MAGWRETKEGCVANTPRMYDVTKTSLWDGNCSHSANGSEHCVSHDQQIWHALMIVLVYSRGPLPPGFTCYSYCICLNLYSSRLC